MRHNYNGFVNTVLPRRVTFGNWQFEGGHWTRDVYLNNHKQGYVDVSAMDVVDEEITRVYLHNSNGYSIAGNSIMDIVPFVGYTDVGNEF